MGGDNDLGRSAKMNVVQPAMLLDAVQTGDASQHEESLQRPQSSESYSRDRPEGDIYFNGDRLARATDGARSRNDRRPSHDDIALRITSQLEDLLAHFAEPEFLVEGDCLWIALPYAEPHHV